MTIALKDSFVEIPNAALKYFFPVILTQWTHVRRFALDSMSNFHVENSSNLHQFWKANPRGNYDNDSMWKFRRGFNFQNRHNIDEFPTWIFLCRFNVESTEPLCSLFPLYISQHFLLWEPILCYSGIVLSRCNFNNIDVITDFGTIGTISFGNFCNNANK